MKNNINQLDLFEEENPNRLAWIIYQDNPYNKKGFKDKTKYYTWSEQKPMHIINMWIELKIVTNYTIIK